MDSLFNVGFMCNQSNAHVQISQQTLTLVFLAHSLLHCIHSHCHYIPPVLFVAFKNKQQHELDRASLIAGLEYGTEQWNGK